MDRLYFNDSDPTHPLLPVLATPNWLRSAVAHLSPYTAAVPAFTMAQASAGVITQASNDAGAESVAAMSGDGAQPRCVSGIKDGAWTHTRQVDFGASAMAPSKSAGFLLSLRVNVPVCGVGDCPRLTVHLDTLDAAAVTNCVLNSTVGWATVRCPIADPLQGVHDVFFLFEGAECVTTMLTWSWWKIERTGISTALPTPTPPAKATIQLMMRACAQGTCTWQAPAVLNTTGVPVGVVALGNSSVLAAKAGLTAAALVLHDHEDGTWGIRIGHGPHAAYACATPQPAGGAVLALTVTSAAHPTEVPCARFRVQVMTGGVYALRSVDIGLWVVVGTDGVMRAEVDDPRSTPATAFTFITTLGLPPH